MRQPPYVPEPGNWAPRKMLLENVDCRLLVGMNPAQGLQDRYQVPAGHNGLDAVLYHAGHGILLAHKGMRPRIRHEPTRPGGPVRRVRVGAGMPCPGCKHRVENLFPELGRNERDNFVQPFRLVKLKDTQVCKAHPTRHKCVETVRHSVEVRMYCQQSHAHTNGGQQRRVLDRVQLFDRPEDGGMMGKNEIGAHPVRFLDRLVRDIQTKENTANFIVH